MSAFLLTFISCVVVGVLGMRECPELEGLQLYPHATHCDMFYMCANGTLTLETCPNGLLFDGLGEVTYYCRYNWQVDCGDRKEMAPPISTEHCPYLYGIFPITSSCNPQFYKCAEGVAFVTDCEVGLAYDDRTHSCNWPDLMDGCDSEALTGVACPAKATGKSAAFGPFPRFAYPNDCTRYVTCVEHKPRIIACGHDMGFNENTLACEDIRNLPGCSRAF